MNFRIDRIVTAIAGPMKQENILMKLFEYIYSVLF